MGRAFALRAGGSRVVWCDRCRESATGEVSTDARGGIRGVDVCARVVRSAGEGAFCGCGNRGALRATRGKCNGALACVVGAGSVALPRVDIALGLSLIHI